ncbi:hypothetical protein COCCADRAFT_106878, partial [Bipolaris zeicola 26-R-13]
QNVPMRSIGHLTVRTTLAVGTLTIVVTVAWNTYPPRRCIVPVSSCTCGFVHFVVVYSTRCESRKFRVRLAWSFFGRRHAAPHLRGLVLERNNLPVEMPTGGLYVYFLCVLASFRLIASSITHDCAGKPYGRLVFFLSNDFLII